MSAKGIVPLKERTATALRPFESLGRVFEDLFDLSLPGRFPGPEIDIKENDKSVEVRAELPGVEKKDISLDLTEDSLTIAYDHREETSVKGGGARVQTCRRFSRSFTLPSPVKAGEAKAEYKDGALKVTLPKKQPAKVRRVDID